MLTVSDSWKSTHLGAHAGILVMQEVSAPERHPELDRLKDGTEADPRSRSKDMTREQLRSLPVLQAYEAYYSRFKKTYHVLLQVESVALKGKRLPNVAALVEAMFIAELKNMLLTAGHDLAAIRGDIRLDAAQGSERYITLSGQEQTLKPGDMFMTDEQGVISSILYGPDRRTRLTPDTRQALFAVYAPAGIDPVSVRQHLEDLRDNIRLIAPEAEVGLLQVYPF
jgi:DNA/RNA-binding domain of Phe-tRNA-synthetase-like protein